MMTGRENIEKQETKISLKKKNKRLSSFQVSSVSGRDISKFPVNRYLWFFFLINITYQNSFMINKSNNFSVVDAVDINITPRRYLITCFF